MPQNKSKQRSSDSSETVAVHSHPTETLNLLTTDLRCRICVPGYSWLYFKAGELLASLVLGTPCIHRQEKHFKHGREKLADEGSSAGTAQPQQRPARCHACHRRTRSASLFPKLLTTKSACPPTLPYVSRGNVNLAGGDQRPAGLQARGAPAQLGRREAAPPSNQEGKQDRPPPVPTTIRGAQRSPGSQAAEPHMPRGFSYGAGSLGAAGGAAVPPLGREAAPGSRTSGAAHGADTAQAPRAFLRGLATHSATDNARTRLRTDSPGAGRRPPCPGLGAGGVAARGRNRDPDPNLFPAPAAHPPLPRAPAAPLRRYRESECRAHRARVELPPTR
ncbi:uncharacterized protein LOC143693435 [Agelaius phoeniceus]|uniref:uncharacterized protein LOC143693435 n=1 Tax=Agelaius phoeniceus TaxID=39638 RepID=UPI004055008B